MCRNPQRMHSVRPAQSPFCLQMARALIYNPQNPDLRVELQILLDDGMICEPLIGQPIDVCIKQNPHLTSLELADWADQGSGLEVDILIGTLSLGCF